MMSRSVSFVLLMAGLLCINPMTAQSYEKAVITHLNYTLMPNDKEYFDSISFPFYFDSEKFEGKIRTTIIRAAIDKFNVGSVDFKNELKTVCCQNNKPKKLRIRKAVDRSDKNTIFIGLETRLHTTGARYRTSTFYPRCFMTTKITVFDHYKIKIYESAVEQPFEIYVEDDITGAELIGELDFQKLYIQNLQNVFFRKSPKEKTYKIKNVIMVRQPVPLKYYNFLSKSMKYEVTLSNNHLFFLNRNECFEVVRLIGGTWRKYSVNDLNRLLPKHSLDFYSAGYQFQNFISNEIYRVYKLDSANQRIDKAGIRPTFKSLPEIVKISIDTGWFRNAGELTYLINGDLSGIFKQTGCRVKWIPENDVIEIYREDSMLGLYKIYPASRIVYYRNDISDEDLGYFINLMHLFEYCLYLQEIIAFSK